MSDAVEMLEVKVDDAHDQAGLARAEALVREVGIADAVAISITQTEHLLAAVMHLQSPMWESNVQGVATLLTALTANVMDHRACAERVNRAADADLPRG